VLKLPLLQPTRFAFSMSDKSLVPYRHWSRHGNVRLPGCRQEQCGYGDLG